MSVIIYGEYCEHLEQENEILKKQISFLKAQLEYKSLGPPNVLEDDDCTDGFLL